MFSQTAEYAMRAMACLALNPDRLVPTPDLAKETKVPPNYLAKVLQQLAVAELITGRRGVGGGYMLARPADQIDLLEVINAVDSLKRITTCPLGIASHGTSLCPLHRRLDEAARVVIEIFEGISLADLLSDPSTSKPLCNSQPATGLSVSAKARSDS
jgi:Rrf2 family transcriptional regulator, nitric oxide-sensitive transcriptional repressor